MPQIAITLAITAGGMAVQYLLAPKVKRQPLDKGKMDDIRIQGSDYGAYIPRLLSGKARISGNVVWSTGIDQYVVTTGGTGGGKKNPGSGPVNNYIYKTSLGILLFNNQISTFERIWDNSDLLINNNSTAGAFSGQYEAEAGSRSGTASIYSDSSASGGQAVSGVGTAGTVSFNVSGLGTPPKPKDPDENLTLKTRVDVVYSATGDKVATVGGVSLDLPDTAGAWSVASAIITGASSPIAVTGSSGTYNLDYIYVERFWDNGDLNFKGYRITGAVRTNLLYPTNLDDPSGYYNRPLSETKNATTGTYSINTAVPDMLIRKYTGTETQTQDTKLVSWLDGKYGTGQGTLRASAMRGQTVLVLQDYTMKSNSLGNFTVECDKGTNTLNEALVTMFNDCGLTSSYYSFSATTGKTQTGILDSSARTRRDFILDLERYHGFRLGEIDGVVKTILDDPQQPVASRPAPGYPTYPSQDDLRAHMDGEAAPDHDVDVTLGEEHLLPLKVIVNFQNPDLEYHNDSVRAQLQSNVVATGTTEYNIPVIDTAANARDRSEKLLLKAWAEKDDFLYTAMPNQMFWTVGDIVQLPVNGATANIRIEKKSMPMPIGPVTFTCKKVGQFVPTYIQNDVTLLAPKAVAEYAESTFPRNAVVFPVQSTAVFNKDRGKLGVYLGVCGRGRGDGNNISLYRETDVDNFVLQQRVSSPSTMGLCATTLASVVSTASIDSTHTVDVWFFDDVTLESVTDTDIARLPQINLFRIGDEWVQVKTVAALTLEANSPYRSKYRFSNIWRGRFGTTAAATGSHSSGEYCVGADPSLIFFELEREDVGQTVTFKAVTDGQPIDIAPTTSFTFSAASSSYTVSNGTLDRTFDADATTIDELADVVYTIIQDGNY